jgi:hypothetical protein
VRWAAERLDRFDVEAQPLEGSDNEGPAGQLVTQGWMRLGSGAGVNDLAVDSDSLSQGLDSVGRCAAVIVLTAVVGFGCYRFLRDLFGKPPRQLDA